jgi:shikimate kinase
VSAAGALLVLIGAPGAGKTQIGKRVAQLLRARFVDTDRRIVVAHGPIPELFERFGEARFRELERVEVAKALTERAVVALGGGAVLDPETQRDLRGARVALLTVRADAVASRISGTKRPLVKDGIDSWRRLADSRRELYESLASRSWDTSDRPADEVAGEVAEWVRAEALPPVPSATKTTGQRQKQKEKHR